MREREKERKCKERETERERQRETETDILRETEGGPLGSWGPCLVWS